MMSAATTTKAMTIQVPEDVSTFAVEQKVDVYLPAILLMTKQIFPAAEMSVVVEDDPEIPEDRHIIVQTRQVQLSIEEAMQGRWNWCRNIFDACPAPLVCVFRLGLEIAE
jgi:hypothetical protein